MTAANSMSPVHPGEVLRDELSELDMSARALAKAIKVPVNRITAILNGDRSITADTARRFSRYFGTSTEFWMDLQKTYEIRQAESEDTTNVLDEIVPRQTALLRDAIRDIADQSRLEMDVTGILQGIASNLTLCTQLQAFERAATIGELSDDWMRSIEAPLAEIRDTGVFETKLSDLLPHTIESFTNYENQFKSPTRPNWQRLQEDFAKNASSVFDPHPSMKHLDCAWLNEAEELASMQRLINLQYIGKATHTVDVFSSQSSSNLRKLLGDWRDEIVWPNVIWTDLVARADFYEVLGFERNLTDIPTPVFREILNVTEIRSESPDLIEKFGPLFPPLVNPDKEHALARTNNAHDWLQRLESQLRQFIDSEMTRVFGSEWASEQLPKKLVEKWQKRQNTDEKMGALTKPLLAFADFSDYIVILSHGEIWDQVFEPKLHNRESVRESLRRLYPIRNDTMHSRPITKDDELLLYVETKRLMKGIKSAGESVEDVTGGAVRDSISRDAS